MNDSEKIARALVRWFKKNCRPMPWRLKVEPYACWLSEIMLQQTTYEQALPFYKRFLKRFPTLPDLAAANEQDVLKAWEGLGYYARARNLAKAAKQIHVAGWPTSYEAWLDLPGVGPYTAASLSSVLLGARVPVVDGNVARVFARYWHLADDFKDLKARAKLAKRLTPFLAPPIIPGDFNQAMMELGALVCTPASPQCEICPLRKTCLAYAQHDAESYPQKSRRAPLPTRRRTFVIISDGKGKILLVQNKSGGLLRGLWELPSVSPRGNYTQTFSHFKLDAAVLCADMPAGAVFKNPTSVPLTTAAKRILQTL